MLLWMIIRSVSGIGKSPGGPLNQLPAFVIYFYHFHAFYIIYPNFYFTFVGL